MRGETILLFGLYVLSSVRVNCQCTVSVGNIHTFIFQGKQNEVKKEKKTRSTAVTCALALGGYLVHIDSEAKMKDLSPGISEAGIGPKYACASEGSGIAHVQTGASA